MAKKKNGRPAPYEDPTSIGNILIAMGVLKQEELDHLVSEFNECKDELLGEFLVRKEIGVTEDHIESALLKQQLLREEFTTESVTKAMEISNKRDRRIIGNIEEIVSISRTLVGKYNGKF